MVGGAKPQRTAATAPSIHKLSISQPAHRQIIKLDAAKGFGTPAKKGATANIDINAPCPCSSGLSYSSCCSKYHSNEEMPNTPEQLLRSRYVAYKEKIAGYIADTTYPESSEWSGTRTQYLSAVKQTMKRMECVELKIGSQKEGRAPEEYFIEFNLLYRDRALEGDKILNRKERSRFLKAGGKWFYMDSELNV
jgi:SEC-C motif-containing protein